MFGKWFILNSINLYVLIRFVCSVDKACKTQHLQGCYHQAIMMYTTFEDILHPKSENASKAVITPEILKENDKVTNDSFLSLLKFSHSH